MERNSKAKILALIVFGIALSVVVGWFFDIQFLKSLRESWITMKLTTAFCFLLSSMALFLTVKIRENKIDWPQVLLPVIALTISLLMITLLVSFFLKIPLGIEDLFVREKSTVLGAFSPGKPSPFTMVSFLFIAAASIYTSYTLKQPKKYFGLFLCLVGMLPVIGYLFNVPLLYYYFAIPNYNTAMAFHTAVCYLLLGSGYFLVAGSSKKQESVV